MGGGCFQAPPPPSVTAGPDPPPPRLPNPGWLRLQASTSTTPTATSCAATCWSATKDPKWRSTRATPQLVFSVGGQSGDISQGRTPSTLTLQSWSPFLGKGGRPISNNYATSSVALDAVHRAQPIFRRCDPVALLHGQFPSHPQCSLPPRATGQPACHHLLLVEVGSQVGWDGTEASRRHRRPQQRPQQHPGGQLPRRISGRWIASGIQLPKGAACPPPDPFDAMFSGPQHMPAGGQAFFRLGKLPSPESSSPCLGIKEVCEPHCFRRG